ncbi:EpsG family protein [Piscibacillus halophilus]|uniref:EpsG family protein n=1 Tax=Piscibacillus halophilus TaxID=571933 RepID=UPI0024097D9A|nr:EpsG family protein [Piscibacillus halophilus]
MLLIPELNKKYPFYILSFGVLFLFLALRYDYGNDYMSYYQSHELINAGFEAWGSSDVLYRLTNLLIPNFYVLVAFLSLFYIGTIFFLVKYNLYRKQYWFAVLILLINPYLFLVHLSSFRQTIAICFVIIAVYFATKRNLVLYFLFVLVAMGFHPSAIVMFPVYFLLNEKKIKVKKVVLVIGAVFLLLLTPLLDSIIEWSLSYFPSHYSYYYNQGAGNTLRATLISSFFFFLILFNINKLNGKDLIYAKLSLIATIISLLAYKVSMITRIGMYFDVFLIVSLPIIFLKMKGQKLRFVLFVLMLVIFILRYWSFFNNEIWMDSYRVYQTILSK